MVVKRMGPHLRSTTHGIAPTAPCYADLSAAAVIYKGENVQAGAAKQ